MAAVITLKCSGKECDARTTTEADADTYGAQHARSLAEQQGWTSRAPGRTMRGWQDFCSTCSAAREKEQDVSTQCLQCAPPEKRSPLRDLFGHTALGHRTCGVVMREVRFRNEFRPPEDAPLSLLLDLEDEHQNWISDQPNVGPAMQAVYTAAVKTARALAAEGRAG